jgi:peptide/nickel transport system substrate-binding protein
MYRERRWLLVVSILVVVSLVLGACGTPAPPAAPPEEPPAEPTTATTEPTKAPAEEPTEEPPEEGTPRGGSLIFCMWEDVGMGMNPYRAGMVHYWQAPALQRLISWDADGDPVPMLAAEVPTLENGGVSEDGKTITYQLREGVKWADGEDFTCEDVKFTLEGVNDPANMVVTRAGYEQIETVECPDPLTVVVKYSEFFAPWITLPLYVVPKHLLEDYPDWNEAPWATNLLGTGPFYVTENVGADHVTFDANPYYWEEGQPYLDQWIIRYVPSREAGIALFKAGDCDVLWDLSEAELVEFMDMEDVSISSAAGNSVERLWLNHSVSSGPNHGLPEYPHPVLGDVRVRQALELAIDKQALVESFLFGLPEVATTIYPHGFYADDTIAVSEFNPEKAGELLEEAGWTDEDGDGVRECHGCLHAEEGDKLEISFITPAGLKVRELTGTFITEQWGEVGVKGTFGTATASEVWSVYADGGQYVAGTYDVHQWTETCGVDPQTCVYAMHHSSQIPRSATECGNCWNGCRWSSPEFDTLIEQAGQEPDANKRQEMFSEMLQMLVDEVVTINLYNRAFNAAVHDHVKGWLGPYDSEAPFEYLSTWAGYIYMEK